MRQYKPTQRFHVTRPGGRTTISLDSLLVELLAIRLDATPYTQIAHGTVQRWLQEQVDAENDLNRAHFSQWLAGQALLFVADPALVDQWHKW